MEPPGIPGHGWNSPDKIEFAARTFTDEKFREYYEHRAAELLERKANDISETARERLAGLL